MLTCREQVLLLHDVLALSKHLPTIAPMLVRIIDSCLSQADPDPQTEYADSCTNSAWVIGACLECLSARPSEEWGKTADMLVWATTTPCAVAPGFVSNSY